MKAFRQYMASQFLITLAVISFATVGRCNKCTSVLSRNEIQTVVLKVPCVQKYEARCGWLSLNYCTFYHQTHCDKHQNETVKTYYIHTDCCEGYVMVTNGSCIKRQPGVVYHTTPVSSRLSVDPNYVGDPVAQKATAKDKLEISVGGYAGIACGLVLLASIVGFVIIAVLKKKRRKKQKPDTSQEVQYIGTETGGAAILRNSGSAGSIPIVRNSGSLGSTPVVRNYENTRSPSLQMSISPASTRMVTAPSSPVRPVYSPVETPLLASSKANAPPSPVKSVSFPATEPLMSADAVSFDIPESDI